MHIVLGNNLRSDINAYRGSGFRNILLSLFTEIGIYATAIYRLQSICYRKKLLLLSYLLHHINYLLFGFDAMPGSEIGKGLFIPHPNGVVIGAGVKVGKNARIMSGVTIGVRDVAIKASVSQYPTIGDDCILGTKSSLLGGISLGRNCKVSAHSLVLNSFPDQSNIKGIPAKRSI